MMKILFVDDERLVLDGIERTFFDSPWEISTACSGEEALELLENEHHDVIITDMRMPGMDGEELLKRVEAKYPDMVRMVLSGQADQAVALRSGFISHRWLDKPFNCEEMQSVLSLVETSLASLPKPNIRKLVCGIKTLPSPPRTYAKIQQLIQNRADLEDVAAVISEDISLASKVLQVTNSALFSRGGETSDIHAAVVRLGGEMVSEFVLFSETYAMSAQSCLLDMEKIIKESFMISRLTALVADHIDATAIGDAKLAGLLSDIGQGVLLLAFPDKAHDYVERIAYATEEDIEAIEMELFGVIDTQIGAYLLLLWGFSAEIFNAVLICRHWDKCVTSSSHLPAIVFIARHLARGRELSDECIAKYDLEQVLPDWKQQADRLRAR